VVDAARSHLQAGADAGAHDHQAMSGMSLADQEAAERVPFHIRVRSLAGWSDAASYTMADITMLRREMVIGFGVAGFLAVLVPDAVWAHVFISGNGFWTSLENAFVGPFIAIISFVCSIGNVPLAAALWKGGISFGGVVAFIFADLITLPLLIIYRKYFGTKVMLRILVSFWIVMSLGGLAIGYLVQALGLVPTSRPTQIAPTSFAFNYTSVLDVIFIAIVGILYYLHRNRARFGGGAGYAIDPVCGMQVETSSAPARATHNGVIQHFCSDRCREKFARKPERFVSAVADTSGGSEVYGEADARAADPVCGMTVEPGTAATHRIHEGRVLYFCSTGCAEAFDLDPVRYTATATH
jgi:YHS domain-containing protein